MDAYHATHRRLRLLSFIAAGFLLVLALAVLLTPWPSDVLARPLTVNDPTTPVDAVIILGGGTKKGSDALPLQAKFRVHTGVSVSNKGEIPIIVSGGYSKKTHLYEAPLLADETLRDGADEPSIILESASRSTYENAVYSLAIVREHGWGSVAVVTSDYHTWRACRVFRKQFSSVRCVAAQSRDAANDSVAARADRFRSVVREYGAIVYYAVKGYL